MLGSWITSPGGQEARRKAWHGLLVLGSAYAATDPRWTWAVPVLTGMAGVSAPPSGLTRAATASAVIAAGLASRLMSLTGGAQ